MAKVVISVVSSGKLSPFTQKTLQSHYPLAQARHAEFSCHERLESRFLTGYKRSYLAQDPLLLIVDWQPKVSREHFVSPEQLGDASAFAASDEFVFAFLDEENVSDRLDNAF